MPLSAASTTLASYPVEGLAYYWYSSTLSPVAEGVAVGGSSPEWTSLVVTCTDGADDG